MAEPLNDERFEEIARWLRHIVKEPEVADLWETDRATMAAERAAKGKAERERDEALRWKEERSAIVGFNDGFEEAIRQVREDLVFPTMLRKMWSGSEIANWIAERLAPDRWLSRIAPSRRARAERAEADVARMREGLVDATANLAGAASAYRAHASRSSSIRPRCTSDALFTTRIRDFDNAVERARSVLEGKS